MDRYQGYNIIGVSGGPDSMYLLNKLHNEGVELFVVHVNYGWRPEADDDEQLVNDFCSERKIPFSVVNMNDLSVDVKDILPKIKNKQAAAREFRFHIYTEMAKKLSSDTIYLAHHRDDFIETAYMLEQREGDYLYYGIKEYSHFGDLDIVRPLLHMYKDEIVKYNDEHNIPYAIDQSNLKPIYERNKVRIMLSKLTVDEKEKMYEKYMKINKEKESLRKQVDFDYGIFEKSFFDYQTYMNIEEEHKKYVIYKFLIHSKYRINISSSKIEGIIDFLKQKKGDKGYRVMENVFLGVRDSIIVLYEK